MSNPSRVFFCLLLVIGAAIASLAGCGAFGRAPAKPGEAPAPPSDFAKQLLPVIETFAGAAVQLHLTDAVKERAPQLLAVIDANHDGAVTLDEIKGADLTSPAVALVVLLTAERLVRER